MYVFRGSSAASLSGQSGQDWSTAALRGLLFWGLICVGMLLLFFPVGAEVKLSLLNIKHMFFCLTRGLEQLDVDFTLSFCHPGIPSLWRTTQLGQSNIRFISERMGIMMWDLSGLLGFLFVW